MPASSGRRSADFSRHAAIPMYQQRHVGHLPQCAPTSPMLSILAMRGFDAEVTVVADRLRLAYTRYADELSLSTSDAASGSEDAARTTGRMHAAMARWGHPDRRQGPRGPPGARKMVLGLVVDTDRLRLPREFRDRLRQHLLFVTRPDVKSAGHDTAARGFTSVHGLREHVFGLGAFAHQVDPGFADKCRAMLDAADSPF